jgi:flagellar biogenesis protein FliO
VQPATQIPLAITEEVLSTMNQTSGNTAQLLVNYQAGNQEETQSINKYLKQNTTSSGLTVGYYLKVLFSIALLSAILYLVTKFSKTIQKQKYTGEIKVTDRLPIDQHVALLIVTLNRQRYLLSLSNKSVTVLDKLEPKV